MTREYIKTDKNGTRYYRELRTCDRCGNLMGGLYAVGVCNDRLIPSHVDGGVCWKCHGTGKVWETVKEYTPEHLAKLEKAREKRAAKKAAEIAERAAAIAAENERIEAERKAREAEAEAERARIAAERAISQHVGNVGDKIEITATFTRSLTIERRGFYDWQTFYSYLNEFVDENGNVFVWFTTACFESKTGDTVKLCGTIKKHDEYKGQKQNVLTRCKVKTIAAESEN